MRRAGGPAIKVSRRKLVGAAVGGALAWTPSAPPRETAPASHSAAALDPVIAQAAFWSEEYNARETMIEAWQALETALFRKARLANMPPASATRSGFAEARALRRLGQRIKTADKVLARQAKRIAVMRAVTPAGALAQLEMALRLQAPTDWEEDAGALLLAGVKRMRVFLCEEQTGFAGS